jgi:hypothetical protein
MVVDILRHLPPRSLAVSRCICTLWRATVDHHRLLRADLLPLSLDAVIYSQIEPSDPQLLCRPSTGRSVVTAILNDTDDSLPADCCNGLLLLENTCVFNPATRQSVRLPKFPSPCTVADCTGGPSWRLKGAMAPPTQLKFTQYHLVFISFDHVKYKIF